ncbi:MAG: ZIP family metal transporter [Patescibacteria group bacterium]
MATIWFQAIMSVVAVSVVSLIGAITLSLQIARLKKIVFALVALAAGALFGDVIIHIIPKLFESGVAPKISGLFLLIGILTFFILEKFLHWSHQHEMNECVEPGHNHPPMSLGKLNLTADGLHNFIDGLIIGASYLVSPGVGLATTFAVILHEIPQEIGDFGILIHAGFTVKKALLFNLLSASLAIFGTIIALMLGSQVTVFGTYLLAVAGGGFLYIAGSDLLPELQKTTEVKKSLIQFLAMLVGIGLMFALLLFE